MSSSRWLARVDHEPVLTFSIVKPLSSRFVGIVLLALAAMSAAAQPSVLTTALEVRSLSLTQAEQAMPVTLRGIVVYIEPASVFVQDATSTAFFRPGRLGDLRPGDEIEVRGTTRMGLFLPGIGPAEFQILRHAALPAGIAATFDDLVAARHHYKRVTVEGIVRSLAPVEEGRSLLRLAMGSRILEVRVDAPPDRSSLIPGSIPPMSSDVSRFAGPMAGECCGRWSPRQRRGCCVSLLRVSCPMARIGSCVSASMARMPNRSRSPQLAADDSSYGP